MFKVKIILDLYSAVIYRMNMIKWALQESAELKIERLRSSATAAHKFCIHILIMLLLEETDHTASGSLPYSLDVYGFF